MANRFKAGVDTTDNIGRRVGQADDDAVAGVRVKWLEVDGERIPGTIIAVDWHADGEGFHEVTVRFACSSFETVDSEPVR